MTKLQGTQPIPNSPCRGCGHSRGVHVPGACIGSTYHHGHLHGCQCDAFEAFEDANDGTNGDRRKRAKELRFTLLGAAHNWRACWRPEDDGDRGRHWNRLIGALDELERMAIEGGSK